MPDTEELNRMMVEISAGWKYGDPRSKVPKRKDIKKSWKRLKREMDEMVICRVGATRPGKEDLTTSGLTTALARH